MRRLDCGTLQVIGIWEVDLCCPLCLVRGCSDGEYVVEIGSTSDGERVELEVCCAARRDALPLTGADVARLLRALDPQPGDDPPAHV